MKLSEILPSKTNFKVAALDDELNLSPITLADEIWMSEVYGENGIKEIFERVNFAEICRVVYRLLDNESKSKLKKQKVIIYNEEGEESEVEIGGVKLLYALISGWDEKNHIMGALLKCLGFTEQMVDDLAESSGKKKDQLKP